LTPPPSTPVAISAANAGQVADAALDPAVGGTDAFGAVMSSADSPQSKPRVLLRAMQAVSAQAKKPRSSSGLSDAPDDGQCGVSGSVTITQSGTDATIRFNACEDVPGQVLNGTVSATAVTDNPPNYSATFSVNLSFTESGSQTLRLVGSFSISETCDSFGTNCTGTFTGSSLGAAHGSEVWFISGFTIRSVENAGLIDVTANYIVASSELNGSVSVLVPNSSPIRFMSGAAYPHSGVVQINGAASSSAVITILSGTASDPNAVRVELDFNGGGVDDTKFYSWNQLETF
jgi:hypothetical protein